MINVRNLHKKFDKTQALDGIDLTINRGSIYGLVGTNGAGKTTLIRHMAGILKYRVIIRNDKRVQGTASGKHIVTDFRKGRGKIDAFKRVTG